MQCAKCGNVLQLDAGQTFLPCATCYSESRDIVVPRLTEGHHWGNCKDLLPFIQITRVQYRKHFCRDRDGSPYPVWLEVSRT